jgi:hypothetical protein
VRLDPCVNDPTSRVHEKNPRVSDPRLHVGEKAACNSGILEATAPAYQTCRWLRLTPTRTVQIRHAFVRMHGDAKCMSEMHVVISNGDVQIAGGVYVV